VSASLRACNQRQLVTATRPVVWPSIAPPIKTSFGLFTQVAARRWWLYFALWITPKSDRASQLQQWNHRRQREREREITEEEKTITCRISPRQTTLGTLGRNPCTY